MLQPEMREAWKFFLARTRVDGDGPRGQAILLARARRPEIAGTHEHQPVGIARLGHDAKACKTGIGAKRRDRAVRRHVEIGRIISQRRCLPLVHQMQEHWLIGIPAQREQPDAGRIVSVVPDCALVAKADLVQGIVIDGLRTGMRRNIDVGGSGQRLGPIDQHLPVETSDCPCRARRCAARHHQRRARCGDHFASVPFCHAGHFVSLRKIIKRSWMLRPRNALSPRPTFRAGEKCTYKNVRTSHDFCVSAYCATLPKTRKPSPGGTRVSDDP